MTEQQFADGPEARAAHVAITTAAAALAHGTPTGERPRPAPYVVTPGAGRRVAGRRVRIPT